MTNILSPKEKKIADEILRNLSRIKPNILVGSSVSSGNVSVFTYDGGSFTAKGSVSGEAIAIQDYSGEWYVVEGDSVPFQFRENVAISKRKKDRPNKRKTELSISINIGFTGMA